MKRVVVRGRGGQIKTPDKKTKARKEWEAWTVEGLTGAKHTATEVVLCHNYTHSLGLKPSGSAAQTGNIPFKQTTQFHLLETTLSKSR